MRMKTTAILTVCLMVLAFVPATTMAGEACCKKKAAEELAAAAAAEGVHHCGGSECTLCAGDIAAKAEGGCTKSTAKLIAIAEGSGCSKTEALAAQAKEGDSEALEALAAKYSTHSAELNQLAANAKSGCVKSTAKLVEMAKSSGCPKSGALAARVEAGDEDAAAELIAMYSAPATEPTVE